MTLSIAVESPLTADGRDLVEGSQRAMQDVFPPEDIFTFSPDELAGPDVTFLVAREGGSPLGCVAMVSRGSYAEVKRLFIPEAGRGRGLARALMADLEVRARGAGMAAIRLETGEALAPAVRLYEALGYRRCERFGDYDDNPASLFMEKPL